MVVLPTWMASQIQAQSVKQIAKLNNQRVEQVINWVRPLFTLAHHEQGAGDSVAT